MSLEDGQPEIKIEGTEMGGIYSTEGALAVEAKAEDMIKEAQMNEVIRLIERLEAEVSSMEMPARFSRTQKPAESVFRNPGTTIIPLLDLTEDEYKRKTLLISLRAIKSKILDAIASVKSIIEDIEATKEE